MVKKILHQLRALGIKEGDTLLVHSSLSALGYVEGGAQTVIEALLLAVGTNGTLLMPAHSKPFSNTQPYIFSLQHTRTHVGIIPETFRTRSDTLRSIHPTHSVCAVGKHAKELTYRHEQDTTPVGPCSPYRLLPAYNAKILMLGCGLNPNTFMHGIEEMVTVPYGLDATSTVYTMEIAGQLRTAEYRKHNFAGLSQQYRRIETVLPPPALQKGAVLQGVAHCIQTPALLACASHTMRENPYFFVDIIPSV